MDILIDGRDLCSGILLNINSSIQKFVELYNFQFLSLLHTSTLGKNLQFVDDIDAS